LRRAPANFSLGNDAEEHDEDMDADDQMDIDASMGGESDFSK
jgi:hypothetical protein